MVQSAASAQCRRGVCLVRAGFQPALDAAPDRDYIPAAMNRIFLAILALFAGLAAEATPVFARMAGSGETEIGATEAGRGSARPSAVQASPVEAPVARQERRDRVAMRVRPAGPRIYIPSVQLGVDRALE